MIAMSLVSATVEKRNIEILQSGWVFNYSSVFKEPNTCSVTELLYYLDPHAYSAERGITTSIAENEK
jgi:hypothetical protein